MNIIACGALAHELIALKKLNHWQAMKVTCLPAHYHSQPQLIPGAVAKAIDHIRADNRYSCDEPILIAYGDCGTGGLLDKVLAQKNHIEPNINRLPGEHCYAFFAGRQKFTELHKAEIGTFYLTDFLNQHFDTYVWKSLGLDRKPELLDMYFGNYKKLVYLAQTHSDVLQEKAKKNARRLGLEYHYVFTAYGEMHTELDRLMPKVTVVASHPQPAYAKAHFQTNSSTATTNYSHA